VESPEPVTLDLDKAEAQIRPRWFVWTAAGLTVHPVTWIDQNEARAAQRVGRSDLTTLHAAPLADHGPEAGLALGRAMCVINRAATRPEHRTSPRSAALSTSPRSSRVASRET
jgi:hypothetical protein